jgi:hypothetical protein
MSEQQQTPAEAPKDETANFVTWDAASFREKLTAQERQNAAETPEGDDGADDAPKPEKAAPAQPERGADGKFKPKAEDKLAEKPEAAESEAADDGDEDSKLPVGVHRRIARVQKQRDAAREEKDAVSSRLDELRGIVEELSERIRPPEPGDFRTVKEFEAAEAAFKDKQAKLRQALGKEAPKPAAPEGFAEAMAEVQALAKRDRALWTRLREDAEKPQAEQVPISQHMVVAMAEADDPNAVLRALLDDPDKAAEIHALPPTKQLAAILKLERGIAKPAAAAPKPKPRHTQADDPPETQRAIGGSPVPTIHTARSQREFERIREEELKQRRDAW